MNLLSAIGALFISMAIGFDAYSSHGPLSAEQVQLMQKGTKYLFIGGFSSVIFRCSVNHINQKLVHFTTMLAVTGTLMFSGSLIAKALLGSSSALAPYGGMLLMVSWLLAAVGFLQWQLCNGRKS